MHIILFPFAPSSLSFLFQGVKNSAAASAAATDPQAGRAGSVCGVGPSAVGAVMTEERQRELTEALERQYVAGLRRKDGRTVGLGL